MRIAQHKQRRRRGSNSVKVVQNWLLGAALQSTRLLFRHERLEKVYKRSKRVSGVCEKSQRKIKLEKISLKMIIRHRHLFNSFFKEKHATLLFNSIFYKRSISSNNDANATQQVRVRFAPSPTGKLHIGKLKPIVFFSVFLCD